MAEFLIVLIVLFYTVKTIGYGIFTLREKNIAGSIMIFFMCIASLASLFVLM